MIVGRASRFRIDGTSIFRPALALCFVLLTVLAHQSPGLAVIAAAAASALFVLRGRIWACIALAAVALAVASKPDAMGSVAFWAPVLLMACVILLPPWSFYGLIRVPRFVWPLSIAGAAAFLFAALVRPEWPATLFIVPACFCAALLGAGLTRYLAFADARILAWGEDGLETTTRDLLLGRITSGMLHDLAQPLNVISMANGNLGYIAEHLDISAEQRLQMVERIRRISSNTESAAHILSLFRWFGRDDSTDHGLLSVRTALDHAIAVTRSNVRHGGVSIELRGNALDHLLPQRHGAVEMLVVAALLSAFGGFILSDGDQTKIQGTVILQAELTGAHVAITVHCADDKGAPRIVAEIDRATLWLVEQVGRENGISFRHVRRRGQPVCFSILVARDDV